MNKSTNAFSSFHCFTPFDFLLNPLHNSIFALFANQENNLRKNKNIYNTCRIFRRVMFRYDTNNKRFLVPVLLYLYAKLSSTVDYDMQSRKISNRNAPTRDFYHTNARETIFHNIRNCIRIFCFCHSGNKKFFP